MTTTLLLVGIGIVLAILVRFGSEQVGIAAVVGYFVVGIAVRAADAQWSIVSEFGMLVFEFLAALGIIALLFRIGLESRIDALLDRLPEASLIWVGDVVVNLLLGFLVAYVLIGWALIPSLFVAIALTATSVGVSATVWRDEGVIDTPEGALMLDTAEMDDLSGVVLMALLFAIAPVLQTHPDLTVLPIVFKTLGLFLVKLLLFGAACVVFSRYAEQHITTFFQQQHSGEGTMLLVVGISVVVAALADQMGFSMAIGAFLAGLMFSRDPQSVHFDASFASIHDLFVPFFFIGVGLKMDPGALSVSVAPVALLLAAAIVGTLVGAGAPAWAKLGFHGGLLLGVTMWPRAEIALIVMQRGLDLGDWAMPATAFASMVVVSACTVIASPILLRPLLTQWTLTRRTASDSAFP